MAEVDTILKERGETNGDYDKMSFVAQVMKRLVRENWQGNTPNPQVRESLDHMCTKFARIVVGNENHIDHWVDMQGYSELAIQSIRSQRDYQVEVDKSA